MVVWILSGADMPGQSKVDGYGVRMFRSGDEERSARLIELKKKAFRLGLEVGEQNHLESVGWVKSEISSLKSEAQRLNAVSEVGRKYVEGKRLGIARRSKHIVGGQRIGPSVTREDGVAGRSPRGQSGSGASGDNTYVERISPEEGLKATISVMKFVYKDPAVKKDLNGLFAGVFDIQERILDIKPDQNRRRTFESCLQLLIDVGWIENCDIASFDEQMAVVTLRSTTAIADAFGESNEPMCQPVCNLLESIGRKTFDKSVTVTEVECVAQGRPACRFEISPRKAAVRN